MQAQTGWSDRTFVLYYSYATPKSREHAARVRESISKNGKKGAKTELVPELIETLSALVV